jgi:hypothetical protein
LASKLNRDYDGTHCEKYKRKIGGSPKEAHRASNCCLRAAMFNKMMEQTFARWRQLNLVAFTNVSCWYQVSCVLAGAVKSSSS